MGRTDAFVDQMDRTKGALVLTSHPAKEYALCRVDHRPSRPRSLLSTCRHGGSHRAVYCVDSRFLTNG